MNKNNLFFKFVSSRKDLKILNSSFFSNNKAISPVVATALLLVVVVVAVVGFQNWFATFSSSTFTSTEKQSNIESMKTEIDNLIGNTLYIINNENKNMSIQQIKIGSKICTVLENELKVGINEIDITECISGITEYSVNDVVLITDKKILSKKVIIKNGGIVETITFILNSPSNGALLNAEYALLNLSVNPLNDSLFKLYLYASKDSGDKHLIHYDSNFDTIDDLIVNFSKMPVDFDSSLILHYPLDYLNDTNNSYVQDVSGNNYAGEYIAGTFTDNGMIGGAFNKTTPTPIYIANESYNDILINNKQNWSLSVWVNPSNPSSPTDCGMNIIGAGTWVIYFFIDNACQLGVNSYFSGTGDVMTPAGAITLHQWNHVVLTRNMSELKFYVDGNLFHTVSVASTQNGNIDNVPLRLGMSGSGSYDYYGLFDDLAFFDKTLTGNEVSAIYNMTMNPGSYSWHIIVQNSTDSYSSPNYRFNIN